MHSIGLKPGGKPVKCARIVGETLGKYHPHGDASTYEALTQMGVPWSAKYPMIEAQGNFGSLLGDPAAHYRYTEAGLSEYGYLQFEDAKYLNYIDNFDGTYKEPDVLSSVLPVILTNGYSGVAVGFAGSIPAHSIKDIANVVVNRLRGEPLVLRGPSPELPCFLLSDEEEVAELYRTGEGSLRWCSRYIINDKKQFITLTGFAPEVTLSSINKKLKDLIDKELVTIFDDTGVDVNIEIQFKDTRLFREKILPAIMSVQRYSFNVIHDNTIELLNLSQILDKWIGHRVGIWELKIQDSIRAFDLEKRKAETRLTLIAEHDKWVKILDEADIKKVRKGFAELVGEDMVDYALDLQFKQILKLDANKIKAHLKGVKESLKYWSTTTPYIELEKQIIPFTQYKEDETITIMREEDLPMFSNQKILKHWVVASQDVVEVRTTQPTMGRGFVGSGVAYSDSSFIIFNKKGGLEQISVYAIPKKYEYQKEKSIPLALFPENIGYIAARTSDGCLYIRPNNEIRGYKEISSIPKTFDQAILVLPGESLVLRYKTGISRTLTFDQVERKSCNRITKATPEAKGFMNFLETITVAGEKGVLTNKGYTDPSKIKGLKCYEVGEQNFVVYGGTGVRALLDKAQVVDQIKNIEMVLRLV